MIIKVRMADANIGFENDILITLGLGSCIAITFYDRARKIGGMIHYMLPTKHISKKVINPYKYCDLGVPALIDKMLLVGAKTYRMEAKVFGGANMFADLLNNLGDSIGYRNIQAAKSILKEYRIPLIAEDIGENYSRSVKFDIKTGSVKVNSYKKGEMVY